MSKEAKIVPLSDLMGDNIGDRKEEEKKQSDEDLKKAVEGNKEDFDHFNLKKSKEEVDKTEPKTEEEESPKATETKEPKESKEEKYYNFSEETQESEVYKKTLKSMFGNSITHLVQEDEEGNEQEIPIEDVVITEEIFQDIVDSKFSEIKEEASKDKISTKGVSDFTKKLVEIDRNGGDIKELLKVKEDFSDPLENIDITTEEGQIQAIYLRMLAGGQDEDTIRRLIESYRSEGSLEEIGLKAQEELRAAIDQQLEKARQEAEDNKKLRKEKVKEYKKDLKENLKKEFELNDNIVNKVVTLATKEDEHGRFEMDRLYYAVRENPEQAHALALWLLDRGLYDKQITNPVLQKDKLERAGRIRIINKGGGANSQDLKSSEQRSGGDNILPLDRLANS